MNFSHIRLAITVFITFIFLTLEILEKDIQWKIYYSIWYWGFLWLSTYTFNAILKTQKNSSNFYE